MITTCLFCGHQFTNSTTFGQHRERCRLYALIDLGRTEAYDQLMAQAKPEPEPAHSG